MSDIPKGMRSAATTSSRDRSGNVRAFPREYVRLKPIQIAGNNDFITSVRLPQNAAFSATTASRHIAPNKFSSAKTSIPTAKHHVESERFFRHEPATARPRLNTEAMKAKIVFGLTGWSWT